MARGKWQRDSVLPKGSKSGWHPNLSFPGPRKKPNCNCQEQDRTVKSRQSQPRRLWSWSHSSICSARVNISLFFVKMENKNKEQSWCLENFPSSGGESITIFWAIHFPINLWPLHASYMYIHTCIFIHLHISYNTNGWVWPQKNPVLALKVQMACGSEDSPII